MGCGQSRNTNFDKPESRTSARDEKGLTLTLSENDQTVLSVCSSRANGIHSSTAHESGTNSGDIVGNVTELSSIKRLTIIHFNDVYNIEPREKDPVGGAARFATKVASFRHLNPLTAFSGDALNPSLSKYFLRITM